MSAAARLLRRRSSVNLQQYRNFSRLLRPYLPNNSSSLPKSIERNRVFSALADGTPEKPPQKRNGLKYATVGAAVIALSAAGWYTTREQYPQVQHLGLPLPQIWNRQPLEERTFSKSDEGLSTVDGDGDEVQDEHEALKVSPVEPEVHDAEQLRHEVTEYVDEEFVESTESGSHENDSSIVEIQRPPVDTDLSLVEKEHVSAPGEVTQSSEQEKPRTMEAQGDEKETAHVAKGLLLVESSEVESGRDEVTDVGHQDFDLNVQVTEDEKEVIRNKLQEENADMFYSDEDIMDESRRRGDLIVEDSENSEEKKLLEEVMEAGSSEYGAAQSVPSHAIESNVVLKENDDVERYSQSRKEKVFQDVDAAEISREEKEINAEEETPQQVAKVVGVEVLLGAIRTAEQMQAERDSLAFQEQLEKIQEAHKSEVKDFQAKVFAYAQDRDRLEKELKKEKELAEAELKLQLHKAADKLESHLKRKDEEASKEKEKLETFGKAQTAAAVAREKAEHLENIHDMQLQVNALSTAFYARSEEARVSHTAHKLAMGAFALEEAIERGNPVQKETELLISSVGGPGGDPLVDAVVSSIPHEALKAGSWTRAQLHNMFTKLKGPMRELVLMPAGGGGVFTHLLAKVTANLKIAEQGSENVGEEGFEMVIGKVERYLVEGNLIEAATALERAVVGTAAERQAMEWARQARNRAIIEQGLQVVQAHVIAIASGLS